MRDQNSTEQRYLPNAAVLETALADVEGGKTRVVDFCPRFHRYGRLFRPPILVRRIEPLAGRPRITVSLRPSFDYGASASSLSIGSNHLRFLAPDQVLRVTTDMPLAYLTHEAEFALDRPVNLFIGLDEPVPEALESHARQFLDEAVGYWRGWVRDLNEPFDWQEAHVRSSITPPPENPPRTTARDLHHFRVLHGACSCLVLSPENPPLQAEFRKTPSNSSESRGKFWSGRRDSNPRPQPWQGCALAENRNSSWSLVLRHNGAGQIGTVE